MGIVDPRSSHYINFGVNKKYSFFQDTKNIMHYRLQAQNIWGQFNIVQLFESVQNKCMVHIFHHVRSTFEIMCTAFIVLLLKTLTSTYYGFLFVCLFMYWNIRLLILFKCLIAIIRSESRVETFQIFFFFLHKYVVLLKIDKIRGFFFFFFFPTNCWNINFHYFAENQRNSQLILKIWIFSVSDSFLKVWYIHILFINTLLFHRKSEKFETIAEIWTCFVASTF